MKNYVIYIYISSASLRKKRIERSATNRATVQKCRLRKKEAKEQLESISLMKLIVHTKNLKHLQVVATHLKR